ncbi:beta-lactamase family protein [Nonomuraea sp. PA05]|uniref:serine hydrolase domain-containing protein n=1 Tax=Nonomuraea sp. PA05 TaxID=2604466 RepID=UPI0011D6CEA8|nr:serine hydrolase domain-containing protein [Nonomuraea sp. PA05]TYB60662.1 beta-lactamase family protein [Nonomuraea sp. PA05]
MNTSATAAGEPRKRNHDKIARRVLRRTAVTALTASLLAAATAGVAAADSAPAPQAATDSTSASQAAASNTFATQAAASDTSASQAGAAQQRPELQRALQAFVDAGFLGVQLQVDDEQGKWVGSAGVRKLGTNAKPPVNGRFYAGSNTKTVIATVALQLVAEGKIGLDDSVAGLLPEFGLDARITVRMLLQHTSGVFNYTGDFDPDGSWVPGIPSAGQEWLPNRLRHYEPEELVRFALSKPARFEPGTDQRYTNTNYTLAALVIEKVTGRSYAEELRRRIFKPLGLTGTSLSGDRAQLPGPHSHGYYSYEDASGKEQVVDISRQDVSLLSGAGDLITTSQDLHTFFSALNSGKLLPAALLAEMRTPNPTMGYGLGVFVQNLGPNCTVLRHNGSPPHGYGALMYSSPDGKTTVTGAVTWVDSATRGPAANFQTLVDGLAKEVFCGGKSAG